MSSLKEVWLHLQKIEALHFRAKSWSATNWEGVGTGVVQVVSPSRDVLIFRESGLFRLQQGKEIRFFNVFRWARQAETLRLEHLRFGENHPIFLFDMQLEDDGVWREIVPHPCRSDCYRASLHLENDIVFVRWRVEGAERDEVIHYTYL